MWELLDTGLKDDIGGALFDIFSWWNVSLARHSRRLDSLLVSNLVDVSEDVISVENVFRGAPESQVLAEPVSFTSFGRRQWLSAGHVKIFLDPEPFMYVPLIWINKLLLEFFLPVLKVALRVTSQLLALCALRYATGLLALVRCFLLTFLKGLHLIIMHLTSLYFLIQLVEGQAELDSRAILNTIFHQRTSRERLAALKAQVLGALHISSKRLSQFTLARSHLLERSVARFDMHRVFIWIYNFLLLVNFGYFHLISLRKVHDCYLAHSVERVKNDEPGHLLQGCFLAYF